MRHKHLAAGDIPAVAAQEEVREAVPGAALAVVPAVAPAEAGVALAVRAARMDVIG